MIEHAGGRALASLITNNRFAFYDEKMLQDGLAQMLASAGLNFQRECALSDDRRDRPDFVVGDIVVEVKVKGIIGDVIRQLHRYAMYESVTSLVLVTSSYRHGSCPREIYGKPVYVALLNTAFV